MKKLIFLIAFFIAIFTKSYAVDVTFRVDMSYQTVPAEGVHIAGSFQDWDPAATMMTEEADNIYTYTHSFAEGENIEWKYINGDEWGEDESVPAECAQNNNRFLIVPADDIVLDAVCFGSCNECGTLVDVTFKVDMSEETVSPDGVHIAGNFQGWDPSSSEMINTGDNIYEITLPCTAEENILWKYVNGNSWDGQESVPEACGDPDGYGAFNRIFLVPDENTVLDVVCYSSCDPCGYVPVEVDITFQVDMTMEDISPDGIHIAGSMQEWDPGTSLLTDVGDGIYNITFTLLSNELHQFKYINGMEWADAELVPMECGMDDGNGAYNRFFTVPEEDMILPLHCFSSCEPCMTSIEKQLIIIDELIIQPNPVRKNTSIKFNLQEASVISINATDISGKQIQLYQNLKLEEGKHQLPLNKSLESGLYLLRLNTENGSVSKKLIVQ